MLKNRKMKTKLALLALAAWLCLVAQTARLDAQAVFDRSDMQRLDNLLARLSGLSAFSFCAPAAVAAYSTQMRALATLKKAHRRARQKSWLLSFAERR